MTQSILVATRKGLFTVKSPGHSGSNDWSVAASVAFLGNNVTLAQADPRDGSIYAALNLGHFGVKLHRSSDQGATWEECAVPVYPEKPADYPVTDSTYGQAAPWTLKQIWSIEPAGADRPGVLWVGTIPGGLFRSADGARSWELVLSLWDLPERLEWFGGGYDYPGIHSICINPRDSRSLTVGVSCGGVWHSDDEGSTWECRARGMWASYMPPERRDDPIIQDPHRMVQCAASPESLWVQHHNGVFRSTDGARSWQECPDAKPSVFGFAVAVHPRDPETAWFVPAANDECRVPIDGKTVVARTHDGGKSFEVLRHNLPQENSYHLVYRHGLDIDAGGDRLVVGSTTGGLWVSEDQGDSWECVAMDLPPIYSVRFRG
ncbi:MAG: WD40/YVTN/BNR-like repeat-containing protein [Acidobacteriota bacterium]